MHKIIYWTKKGHKIWHKWQRTCLDSSTCPHKWKSLVKIQFISRIILFQETFKFKQNAFWCFGRHMYLININLCNQSLWCCFLSMLLVLLCLCPLWCYTHNVKFAINALILSLFPLHSLTSQPLLLPNNTTCHQSI
jgi:hypothetical protein